VPKANNHYALQPQSNKINVSSTDA